jgi:hypothetical protein
MRQNKLQASINNKVVRPFLPCATKKNKNNEMKREKKSLVMCDNVL